MIFNSAANNRQSSDGFMMPSVVIIASVILTISLAIAQYVVSTNQIIGKAFLGQVAQVAAKSGVNYAQDQFFASEFYDPDPDHEVTIIDNVSYKATFSIDIDQSAGKGLSKQIVSVGKVYYLDSDTPIVTKTIRSVVRTSTSLTDPSVFRPIAWYDAADASTLYKTATPTYGQVSVISTNIADYINEKSDGTQTQKMWEAKNLFVNKYYAGVLFNVSSVPKGTVITDAYMILPKVGSSALTWDDTPVTVEAMKPSAIPSGNVFSDYHTSNQLAGDTVLTSTPGVDWQLPLEGAEPTQSPSLKTMVQTVFNDSDFDPTNKYIGFRFKYKPIDVGQNFYRFKRGAARLVVKYGIGSQSPGGSYPNGTDIARWDDKSGYGFNLTSNGSNWVTYSTNQSNGLPMLNFGSGAAKSLTSKTLDLPDRANSITAFMYMKPDNNTDNGTNIITVTGNAPAGDGSGTRTYRFRRNGGNKMQFIVEKSSQSITATSDINMFDGTGRVFMGGLPFNRDYCYTTINKAPVNIGYDHTLINAPLPCPDSSTAVSKAIQNSVTINIGDSSSKLRGKVGEIIVYDRLLNCEAIRSVEKYLRLKWMPDTPPEGWDSDVNGPYVDPSQVIVCKDPDSPIF